LGPAPSAILFTEGGEAALGDNGSVTLSRGATAVLSF
jgi:hypothetical protein